MSTTETMQTNKAAVTRFNERVIAADDEVAFRELVAPDFVNRTAPPGAPPGPEGMWAMLHGVLRAAFPDLTVRIHDQLAEGDKVVTRKTLSGTHRGPLFGIAPTGRHVTIDVIDIVRLRDGKYVEHWSVHTLASVLAELRAP